MKVTLEWLRRFVPIEADADEVARVLTMTGFEVEAVERASGDADRLKVAQIVKIKPHPNADKLKICEVDTGDDTVDVVCGAPNISEGMRSIWAPPGTRLPGGRTIEETVIRGARSEGMLCSLRELALEEKSKGIHEFGKNAEVGSDAAPILGIESEVVFDIGITPNRGDALSVVGLARELAAAFGVELKKPDTQCPESGPSVSDIATLEVHDPIGCPRYVARVIQGIKIGPSPTWIQKRLETCGVRAINNIVDITNYVMLEMGQPLHAFDMDRLAGPGIVVRRSKAGEKFVTLDEMERLLEDDLLICDTEKPVALAGVMGGLNSEVTEETVNVLLESACFDPSGIRRTSKRLGLTSEASYRFERGVDPCLQLAAADRAAALMAEYADGKIAKGALDDAVPVPEPPDILLPEERVELYLGVNVPSAVSKRLLESLEFDVREADEGLIVIPPTWRGDINEEADVIEEVARLYGYDKLPATLPEGRPEPVVHEPEDDLADRLRMALTGAGYFEIVTLSFMNPGDLDSLGIESGDDRRRAVELMNPLSKEESVMRTTLAPGLLKTARYNLSRFQEDVKLFEVGRVFIGKEGQPLPEEPIRAGGIMAPPRRSRFHRPNVHPFYLAKGAVEEVFSELKLNNVRFHPRPGEPYMLAGESAVIYSGEHYLGHVGRVKPSVEKAFEIPEPAFTFELDFAALLKLSSRVLKFKPLPVYPPAFRDLAVVVTDEAPVAELEEAVREVDNEVIREVRVFDVYRGEQVPERHKSVALSIVYQWPDKSPVDEEVNRLHNNVAGKLEKKFGARIR